jgi:integrase/recombinase XerD
MKDADQEAGSPVVTGAPASVIGEVPERPDAERTQVSGDGLPAVPIRQADSDAQLLRLWLYGRSPHTQRAYEKDAKRFLIYIGKPLGAVTLGDLQGFAESLASLSPASRARTLSAVKSLFAFAHRLGYLPFDVGAPLAVPGRKNTLAERILPEAEVHRMLALEPKPRNQVLLRLFYAAGLRVSELCALTWRDLQPRGEGGQVTVYGKGEKTRAVLLSQATWQALMEIKAEGVGLDGPVFPSRKWGGHLDPSQALRIVRGAARRAGINLNVSPHWLRHAHASHALDRGCPIHLVQATLGHASVATTGRYLHARPTDSSSRYLGV